MFLLCNAIATFTHRNSAAYFVTVEPPKESQPLRRSASFIQEYLTADAPSPRIGPPVLPVPTTRDDLKYGNPPSQNPLVGYPFQKSSASTPQ